MSDKRASQWTKERTNKQTNEWMNEWIIEWNISSLRTSNRQNTLLEYTIFVFIKSGYSNLYCNKTQTCLEAMDTQI